MWTPANSLFSATKAPKVITALRALPNSKELVRLKIVTSFGGPIIPMLYFEISKKGVETWENLGT